MLQTEIYKESAVVVQMLRLMEEGHNRLHLNGLSGSLQAVLSASLSLLRPDVRQLLIAGNKEEAYYLLNDIETLLDEREGEIDTKRVLLFPTTYRRPYVASRSDSDEVDNANVLMRSEVVKQLNSGRRLTVVTYPEALCEKVVSRQTLTRNTLQISRNSKLDVDFLIDVMQDYEFERVDFVVEPGQYAVRGGIVDVFSFANENPFRIELFDDEVDSLRTFDPATQLSIRPYEQITILPNLEARQHETVTVESKVPLTSYFDGNDVAWVQGLMFVSETIESVFANARMQYEQLKKQGELGVAYQPKSPEELYCSANDFLKGLLECRIVESGNSSFFSNAQVVAAHSEAQPVFNKQFDLLARSLNDYAEKGYRMYIAVGNESQLNRLNKIFESDEFRVRGAHLGEENSSIQALSCSLNKGFIDHDEHLLCFTDHEIFERYHKYTVRDLRQNREAMTLKELFELKPGDFVTHIDYGVGRFSGLEKITTNGRTQEVIRLMYKNNDVLYISIHGLHKISRYVGKDGVAPTLNRLGSSSWQVLKQKTKKQVKDIAKDLIALYAKRKATKGFAFSGDSYLQHELEASFIYEDTPDQLKATIDVKRDMEASAPMDRLVCGDVGFGKTEIAIRAAFKAVCDSKQVAVLVPNTILAFQHYNTFSERLKGLPVNIDYLNRFRSTKDKNRIYREASEGKLDILIGTHAMLNKNLKFKDLGLLVIDEEQKFGVSAKEKLRQMKVNVDCLTLTATPIPRTLQFSLMGARDLSVIQTPPPNRQPIETELCPFSEEVIRDAILYEMSRGGQTFFVSNRVENLPEMAGLVQRLVPDARVAIAHGQMDGKLVEERLMQFLEGELDVLVSTSIVENGLDIPNANTMIINNAQNFGLSGLHQMRGRVGRSNRKAFCYMLIPSFSVLTSEAQKRMKAIEEFSSIGSGFNIAMRDLDIRGAGNILGAEQSGFISDIGYDMYHKILNEAIEELKETDFKELFQEERERDKNYVRECLIETDLEVMLPDDYVSSGTERLVLYKELNSMSTEQELQGFRERLVDRFGPIPTCTEELIATITLRQRCKEFGIERLVLKQDKMLCYFVSSQDNPFYQSLNFMKMIRYVQSHPKEARLKETSERLTLTFAPVTTISHANELLQALTA
ncbi:MAG: transcription-repair coupling factor [Bacteroidales bacterium]|nr:transcription-repair coupling factor [Bacteroidales bacterium]